MAETSPDSANGETTAFISPPLDRTTQNMTEFRLTLAKQVNGKKTTSAMLKQALDHYDIEVGVEALTTPVLAILDYIFSLEEVEWPSEQDHVYMMAGKVRLALQSFLRILGYTSFSFYGEDGKSRMEIMPAPGYNPPALPDWLQIPYLVPVVGRDLRLRYDDFINPEGEEHAVGTLGAIMASGDTYVALTAGHVIKDEVSEMMVQESADNPVISLEVPQPFRRINGRPVMHLSEPSSLRDECGMLLISEDDIHQFNYVIPRLNTHFFETFDSDHENQVPGDPIATSRCEAIKNLVDKEPIIVFKQGAATGLTMGSFERIFDPSAFESKSKNDGDNESEDEEGDIVPTQYDNNEWMGCVRGVNDSLPFTASGDSGALVFAMSQDGITIPLGIHVGTVVENGVLNGCSIFISLEMFCHQALRVGWRLSFIHEDGMLNPAC